MAQYFTAAFKHKIRIAAAGVTMLTGAAPFVAGLLALEALGDTPHGPVACGVAAASFILGGFLPWLAQNYMGLAGNATLRRRLRDRLLTDQTCDPSGADFVGFAPGERLRVWQGDTDRDIGFLVMNPDALVYYGDEFEWTLPRESVDHIDLAPTEPGLRRILIRWHAPREAGRTLSLESRDASSLSRARTATSELHYRLRAWWKHEPLPSSSGPSTGPESRWRVLRGDFQPPAPLAGVRPEAVSPTLGMPPTDLTGGQAIEDPPSASCAVIMALGIIVTLSIWRIAGGFFAYGQYYQGILWAGLISVLGALGTGYVLHYLQAWEAEQGQQKQRAR
ncbi:MAG: hypothetical protein ABFE08_16965 [Armatimonadia bacterium]